MENNKERFKILDTVYMLMMILPIVCGIIIKILTTPQSEGISITGAKIYFTLKLPIQDLPITESQINSWLVMISIIGLCLFLTHGIKEKADTKRQHIAEWIVENTEKLVNGNMGEYFSGFAPFIAAILSLLMFVSCEKFGGNAIVGTWKATTMEMNIEGITMSFGLEEMGAEMSFTFRKDGTGEAYMSAEGETDSMEFEYEAKGNILYMDYEGYVEEIPYSISGKTMTMNLSEGFVDDYDAEVTLTLKKM